MTIKYLLEKEFRQIMRNTFIPKMIVMFPIIIMCVTPWVTNLEIKNIIVSVVDNDHSSISSRLIHRIEASDYFIFAGTERSYEDAMKKIDMCKTDVAVVIPENYERDITNGRLPRILVSANAVNGTKGSMGSAYLANIINDNLKEAVHANTAVNKEKLTTFSLYNKGQDYKVFMIPALMAILIVMFCGFLPALNIVGEKENGTIEQINVTPISKSTFIIAKLIPYWIISMIVMTICFLLSWIVYGITPEGNILLLYMLAMLLALTFSGIGLVISNYSRVMQQAMFVMWFVMVCMILLSGLFTPVSSMPDWAIYITTINPMKYFIDGMRTVFIKGGTFGNILPQTTALAVFAAAANTLAIYSYKKNG
ncbi:ABC transporter permease [Prevotella sp. HCN-7019]|uniref:ABC transporter permease n=1 Tax=Prevotella sp. HCN-7019 TaxID=3134668 RepID=UPI0030C20B28